MHGNFSSPYSEGSSTLSAEEGLMTYFLVCFFFPSSLLAPSVQQDRPPPPDLAPLENDSS